MIDFNIKNTVYFSYIWYGNYFQNVGRIVGDTGPKGPAGPQGEQGKQGFRGEKGEVGPTGAQGHRQRTLATGPERGGPHGLSGPGGVQPAPRATQRGAVCRTHPQREPAL